jgi:penicillin-binding protein 1C
MGPARLLVALDRAGVTAVVPGGQPGLAVALGGVGIDLQDMVQVYAAIARGGVALPLTARADGTRAEGQRVVSAVAAWQVGDILAGLAPPPGSPPNRLAYKTGTSYGHRDAWAIGFDGAHVAGVWMGRADGTPVPGAFGAEVAAPVLFRVMGRIAPELTPQPAPPPATLMLSTAQLPQPLRQFRPRDAALGPEADLAVAFPPDGAEVERLPAGLKVRVEGGQAPFTWMIDGTPARVAARDREALLPVGQGFVTLSVIDATGRSARSQVRVIP